MAKPSVFLDTSVLIAALLSSAGGSFYILSTFTDDVRFQTNEYVLEELQRVLKEKFMARTELSARLFLILGIANVEILPNPPLRAVRLAARIISKNDAPILAGAAGHSDYLLTLDNEFFKTAILEYARTRHFKIFKPKEFIRDCRSGE